MSIHKNSTIWPLNKTILVYWCQKFTCSYILISPNSVYASIQIHALLTITSMLNSCFIYNNSQLFLFLDNNIHFDTSSLPRRDGNLNTWQGLAESFIYNIWFRSVHNDLVPMHTIYAIIFYILNVMKTLHHCFLRAPILNSFVKPCITWYQ